MVGRCAQRRFGACDPASDQWCANDLGMVHRIVDALGGGAQLRAENLRQVEDDARRFVARDIWGQIVLGR
jgi:hypothetical protein